MLPALKDLQSYKTGVLTNGDPDQQRAKLETLNVALYFDLVVTSGEVGASKPSPAIFYEACARVSLEPTSCAYVGDRIDSDAFAAKSIGMLGIWLNRDLSNGDLPQGLTAEVPTIKSLTELVALLHLTTRSGSLHRVLGARGHYSSSSALSTSPTPGHRLRLWRPRARSPSAFRRS